MKELALRTVPTVAMPKYAVVQLSGYGGEDVAWFFKRRDAERYIRENSNKRKEKHEDNRS